MTVPVAGDMAVPGSSGNVEKQGSSLILSHLSNVVERISRRRPGESRDGDKSMSSESTLNLTVYDRLLGGAVTLGASLALIQLSMYLVKRACTLIKRQRKSRDRRKRINQRLSKENMNIQYTTPGADECRYSWYHYVLPVFLAELLISSRDDMNDLDNVEDGFEYNDEGSDCLTFDSDFEKPDSTFAAQASQRARASTNEVNHPQCHNRQSLQFLSGSCHCQSVQFILRRPPMHIAETGNNERPLIQAHDSPGKIRYPKVPLSTASSQFELAPASMRYLKTYNGVSSTTDSTAHAFCSECGVHILYAPDSKLDFIEVNGNCLNLSGATANGDKAPELHVSWRPLSDRSTVEQRDEMEWKQRPKSDSVSTHMTEATTVTLSSGFHEQHTARSSDQTVSRLERGPVRPPFQTPNTSVGSFGFMTNSFDEVGSSASMPAPGAEAVWRESQHASASHFSPSGGSRNNSSPTNSIKSDVHSGFSRSSFTASSGSRRKRLGIESTAKQNLMHYMRRHLASPKEADEESAVKGN